MAWTKIRKEKEREMEQSDELPDLPPHKFLSPKKDISKQKEITRVVLKLPVQEIRQYKDDDGAIVNLITVEEALTEIIGRMDAGA